ncbi:unnamed protein product [Triticum turgidum subsp. durum]|uniref:Uncharacterized protein n=1 Tax=Triticum turgidum subsp. durum TaxID=4567 RepID=A0A9R0W273_TRITD|nr:unnamed protein product [Triticum turgidum subsp. durum]
MAAMEDDSCRRAGSIPFKWELQLQLQLVWRQLQVGRRRAGDAAVGVDLIGLVVATAAREEPIQTLHHEINDSTLHYNSIEIGTFINSGLLRHTLKEEVVGSNHILAMIGCVRDAADP